MGVCGGYRRLSGVATNMGSRIPGLVRTRQATWVFVGQCGALRALQVGAAKCRGAQAGLRRCGIPGAVNYFLNLVTLVRDVTSGTNTV